MSRHRIQVKPGSTKGPLVEMGEAGVLVVYVRERAVDGAANTGVISALARHFGVSKSRIQIVRGHAARIKTIEVDH